jgi:hypothetical protein
MKRPCEDAHGLSERENAILTRHDAGIDKETIAAELGLAVSYVRKVASLYAISRDEELLWRRAAKLSNEAFLSAVGSTGRRFA